MGKNDEEQSLPPTVGSEPTNQNVGGRCGYGCERIRRIVGLRCLLVLVLSAAVFLSALFWLPPFFHYSSQKDLDIDSKFKDHQIVASFNVEKSVSFLEEHVLQLEDDIFEEIPVPSAKVIILSMEPLIGSNLTEVVFAVDPERSYPEIPETSLSLIRSTFETLVLNRPPLRLTTDLLGKPVSFEVLKFRGGITIIPPQSAFLLQKVQIYFNFTLNFSIYQIQSNFNKLTSQLKSALRLAPYENMYIRLSNTRGSTVGAPTIVQCSVLLSVGNTPSTRRLKQLAQTITGLHSKNLGLNNTEFGRVKQVRLSSILNHSLSGGYGNGSTSSPSPAPDHSSHHRRRHHRHHHHHHHHQHHHHHHHAHLAPANSPSPWTKNGPPGDQIGASAPEDGSLAPQISSPPPKRSYEVKPRSKVRKRNHLAPAPSPDISPKYAAASPRAQTNPRPPASPTVLASSPLPNVIYAHLQPPSVSDHGKDTTPSVAPSQSPSPSPSLASTAHPTRLWALTLFLVIILQL